MNANWPRWVFASMVKHFKDELDAYGYNVYFEGQHRENRTSAVQIEIRIDGPYLLEVSNNYWEIFNEVNILVSHAMNDTYFLGIHDVVGKIALAFKPIKIYKLGPNVTDDGSFVFCMNNEMDYKIGKKKLMISHFGQIKPTERIMQAVVEGHYSTRVKG